MEKILFGAATLVLYAWGLVTVPALCAAAIDLLFAILFILAYVAAGNVTNSKHTDALNHSSLYLEELEIRSGFNNVQFARKKKWSILPRSVKKSG